MLRDRSWPSQRDSGFGILLGLHSVLRVRFPSSPWLLDHWNDSFEGFANGLDVVALFQIEGRGLRCACVLVIVVLCDGATPLFDIMFSFVAVVVDFRVIVRDEITPLLPQFVPYRPRHNYSFGSEIRFFSFRVVIDSLCYVSNLVVGDEDRTCTILR